MADFQSDGTGIQHFLIMKLDPICGREAELYETTLGGVHFMFNVRIAGNGHYFISARAALEWYGEEKARRERTKRNQKAREKYWREHTSGF